MVSALIFLINFISLRDATSKSIIPFDIICLMTFSFGLVLTAFFAGKFNYTTNLIKNFLKLLFATSFIYVLGIFWLGFLIGWDKPIFELGAKPFLLAELFKILLATFTINYIKKIKKII